MFSYTNGSPKFERQIAALLMGLVAPGLSNSLGRELGQPCSTEALTTKLSSDAIVISGLTSRCRSSSKWWRTSASGVFTTAMCVPGCSSLLRTTIFCLGQSYWTRLLQGGIFWEPEYQTSTPVIYRAHQYDSLSGLDIVEGVRPPTLIR